MKYGFSGPTSGNMSRPDMLVTLARRGEELGFEVINVNDHIIIPNNVDSPYPYSETGEFGPSSGFILEQLTTLSFLGAATSSAKLMTAVMVLPHRNPIHTAKILATIDVLTGGRVIVGCGVGWMREEFEVIGAPPFDKRGSVSDEYIQAFKELWTSDNPTFQGEYCSFKDILFEPKPVQKPYPPIWIGGESPSALRRAARLGNGWLPLGLNPKYPLDTIERLKKHISLLYRYVEENGRDPSDIDIGYGGDLSSGPEEYISSGQRKFFTGSSQQIADDIKALESLGVGLLLVSFPGRSLDETLGAMERFTTEVRPLAES